MSDLELELIVSQLKAVYKASTNSPVVGLIRLREMIEVLERNAKQRIQASNKQDGLCKEIQRDGIRQYVSYVERSC